MRGMGRLYKRGGIWWIRYGHRGKDYRESSSSPSKGAAVQLLKKRLQEIGRGRFIGPAEDKVFLTDLLDALKVDYENNGRRSLATLEWRLAPLRAAFGDTRAVDVTEDRIERYKSERLAAKKAAATVNRELAALKRAFRLAVEQRRLSVAPTIKLLAENNAREGFLEPGTFVAVVRHLPEYLQDFARFAYLSGWRKGEVHSLEWSDVDRDGGRITLRRALSKNGEPRVLPLTGELAEIIDRRWRGREYKVPGGTALARHVFHRIGRPVGDFRKAWATACDEAGVAETIFHDLRRSAVRNLERAGVSQSVAMKISGHRTASVYRRYRIVDENDMREALARTLGAVAHSQAANVTPLRAAQKA